MIQFAGTRSTTSHGARTRTALIVAQSALTVLMLAGAGAAIRNFVQAYAAQLGFDSHDVLSFRVNLPEKAFSTWQERVQYYDAMIERIKATPGVTAAAISGAGVPPDGNWRQPVQIVGGGVDHGSTSGVNLVGADYFSVLHIPLLAGRMLHGAHLAVVSKTFVRRYFPGSDPIGRLILPSELSQAPPTLLLAADMNKPYQIVGVVGDVRNDGLHRPILAQAYIPSSILATPGSTILVRTAGDPLALVHAIGGSLRTLNQNQAMAFVFSLDGYLSTFVWSHERFIAVLFGVFSFVALGLAAIGLASVVAYTVEQRTREFGIRTALGAPRWNVLLLTVRTTAARVGTGLAVGVFLCMGLSDIVQRWTQSSLRDAPALGVIAMTFLLAAAVACLIPARRATRVDPMIALRDS